MTLPVAPALFDLLSDYAKNIEQGKVELGFKGATSPALSFCENFYAQFFQNRMGQKIEHINDEAQKSAIRLRLELKEQNGPKVIIRLITLFEDLCQNYPNLLPLAYGEGSKTDFFNFHHDYLPTLLERAAAWAGAENFPEIEQRAKSTLSELQKALEFIPK
jgi:hypothetical protein